MHKKEIKTTGKRIEEAQKVLILLHGRGSSAEDILSLAAHLHTPDFAIWAPQATNHTWYPLSFMASPSQNEPWLSSAVALVGELVKDVNSAGISSENIYFTGFSQGACLTLEFITRNAQKWGGAVAFTGGLVGDKLYTENYKGDFGGTPVFIGTGDPDPHVPVERVRESEKILTSMNASVTTKVYAGRGHTISQEEILLANKLVFAKK